MGSVGVEILTSYDIDAGWRHVPRRWRRWWLRSVMMFLRGALHGITYILVSFL